MKFGKLFLCCTLILLMQTSTVYAAGGYLHTEGNKIYDADDNEVSFSGVNWFGFETPNFAPHGLWSRNWEAMLDQIKSLGYNSIRLPFCNEMLESDTVPNGIDATKNQDLVGLSALEVMDKIIAGAGQRGLKIILDNHRSNGGASAQENGLWYTDEYPENQWIADWKILAARYKGDDTVVAMDLRNEPHDAACWGCKESDVNWHRAAEEAGNAILEVNPNLLILVEGVECYGPEGSSDPWEGAECTWWGGNLMGAADDPVVLKIPNRLVYSPHDYPATVYRQPWFDDPEYPNNLPEVWNRFWGYLHAENTAPILVGEFGTKNETQSDRQWFKKIAAAIKDNGWSWTFWCWNPNSGDTGGILKDDWITVQEEKQRLLETIQYPLLGTGDSPPAPPTNLRVQG